MKIPILLFMVITGCCAAEDLEGASFVFHKVSTTSKVVLKPTIAEPLENITFCLRCLTDNIGRDSFFKLQGNKPSVPQFHLYQINHIYYITIDGDKVFYMTSTESMDWRRLCVSWESRTGIIHFAVNGKFFPRRVLKPGFLIDPKVTVILGQTLASVGISGYKGDPTFVGEIKDVNMWDQALPSWFQLMDHPTVSVDTGNVINWESVDYEVYGDVVLYKPKK